MSNYKLNSAELADFHTVGHVEKMSGKARGVSLGFRENPSVPQDDIICLDRKHVCLLVMRDAVTVTDAERLFSSSVSSVCNLSSLILDL